ncbi:RES family NAD+ phosphorylase [Caballeronia sp. GAFFF1]|uniref:RES family NAD+ phosphorylase n=1 Tax=Caballeronia sp. GAFFF1 TaxID=2921779 RepID=UPI0020293271|nr:RES family NAD+ phosphorylase [Caballeronia sp. GAFFF1]
MIVTDLPKGTTLYRAHTPRWADRPMGGAGAALKGGRFNREGVEALYLSLEVLTALREYQQTSPFLPPCTICSYMAALRDLVDLRQLDRGNWDELWGDWREDWRYWKFEQHIEPPTWVLSDLVRDVGYTGIIFPSQAHAGGTNVVVFIDRLANGNSIEVNDPNEKLPRNQSSWPR